MSEIKLTPYQATVFRDVENLLKTRGNPQGIKMHHNAYWLSKRMAMYIMHNISATSSHPAGSTYANVDRETVYNWIFGLTPEPLVPVTATGNTQQPKKSWIEFYGPFSTETEAFDYPPASTPPAGAPIPSLQTLLWRGDFLKTFWNSDTGFRVPFGFYKTISTTGPALINFSTDWPQHNNVFEVNANGVRFNMAYQDLSSFPYDIQVGQGTGNETIANNVGSNLGLPWERDWSYIGPLGVGTELTPRNTTTSIGLIDPNTNELWPLSDFRWIYSANELGIQDRIIQWGTDQIPTSYGYRIGIVVKYLSS